VRAGRANIIVPRIMVNASRRGLMVLARENDAFDKITSSRPGCLLLH
jgi:hypothetical protein